MENEMVREHTLGLMGKSMLGNTRMGNQMVKEHKLSLMDGNMWEVGRMEKNGMEQFIEKMEIILESL